MAIKLIPQLIQNLRSVATALRVSRQRKADPDNELPVLSEIMTVRYIEGKDRLRRQLRRAAKQEAWQNKPKTHEREKARNLKNQKFEQQEAGT